MEKGFEKLIVNKDRVKKIVEKAKDNIDKIVNETEVFIQSGFLCGKVSAKEIEDSFSILFSLHIYGCKTDFIFGKSKRDNIVSYGIAMNQLISFNLGGNYASSTFISNVFPDNEISEMNTIIRTGDNTLSILCSVIIALENYLQELQELPEGKKNKSEGEKSDESHS